MTFFKIIWALDAVAAIVVLYFFFAGIADGSVNNRNAVLWLFILATFAGIMGASIWLHKHEQKGLANALLLMVAIPAVLFLLYFGIAIATKSRWN